MSSKDLNFAGEAVFEAINNQIQNDDPPSNQANYHLSLAIPLISVVPVGTVDMLKKYLELSPNGPHANDVKEMLKMLGTQ